MTPHPGCPPQRGLRVPHSSSPHFSRTPPSGLWASQAPDPESCHPAARGPQRTACALRDTHIESDPGLPVQLLFRFGAVALQKVLGKKRGRRSRCGSGGSRSRAPGTPTVPLPKAPGFPAVGPCCARSVAALGAVNHWVAVKKVLCGPVRTVTVIHPQLAPATSTPLLPNESLGLLMLFFLFFFFYIKLSGTLL